MNDLVPTQTPDGILSRIDEGRSYLTKAASDFERLRIRDAAKALQVAAEILNRRDVQVEASMLVMDAERAIAKANPPQQGKRTDLEDFGIQSPEVDKYVRQKIRQAHANIDDDQYEALKEKAREEETPLTRAALKRIDRKRRETQAAERREEKEATPPSSYYEIVQCDIRDYSHKIPSRSIDVIITDPPYEKDALPLYAYLRDFASHALRPGGNMFILCGNMYLPQVMAHLESEDSLIRYNWTLCYRMHGASMLMQRQGVHQTWKPILWYVKGNRESEFVQDVLDVHRLKEQDDRYHKWGQNEIAFVALVNKLCFPGDVLCDPFLGGGTTAVAALERGCEFFGADVDWESVRTTRERLEAITV